MTIAGLQFEQRVASDIDDGNVATVNVANSDMTHAVGLHFGRACVVLSKREALRLARALMDAAKVANGDKAAA